MNTLIHMRVRNGIDLHEQTVCSFEGHNAMHMQSVSAYIMWPHTNTNYVGERELGAGEQSDEGGEDGK